MAFGTWEWRRTLAYQACRQSGARVSCSVIKLRMHWTNIAFPRRHQRSKGIPLAPLATFGRSERQVLMHIAVLPAVGV